MWDFNTKGIYNFHNFYIPARMVGSLQRYIKNHIPPGDFLSAVIKNDLKNAVGYADDENLHNLPAYITFLYNHAPSSCWGNEEVFKQWIVNKKDKS